jgi:hypothetical protein
MSSNASKTNFDLNYLAENQPSMCIPRVFENISERQVRDVFEQLDLGQLDHIDIIERKSEKGEKYKRIFIHFSKWYWNDEACAARRRLIEGKDIKVVYNMPWFWKISANRWSNNNVNIRESNAIHEDIRRNVRRGGPRIEFEDEVRQDDRRPSIDRRDDRRPSEARNEVRPNEVRRDDRRPSEARNDRRPSEARNEVRPNEVRRDDRYNEVKPNEVRNNRRPNEVKNNRRSNEVRQDEVKRNDKQTEVFVPVIKEEPTQSAAEIAQLAIINSTKKRKIILKKKDPQPKVELVVVEEVKEENA